MATAILTPRVNNNDDLVRFSRTYVEPGAQVRKGDVIADIETDKATVTVEVEQDGFLLAFVPPLGEMVPVGAPLAWIGESPDDTIPETGPALAGAGGVTATGEPTLKAALLLARLGLSASQVPASGGRLSATDVLHYAEQHRLPATDPHPAAAALALPPGRRLPLDVAERGMVKTVSWHRDTAVAGYVEITLDMAPWEARATAFQKEQKLLMSPLLPMLAYRLVQVARENPRMNSTIVGDSRHEYDAINLGFTLQSGSRLSLLCVRDAGRLSEQEFVDKLNLLMRQGMKGRLTAEESSEVTVAFSSMARWEVTRHVPILPPFTALIVAHTHARDGVAALGASYDHRVLTGGEVAAILRAIAVPDAAATGHHQQQA